MARIIAFLATTIAIVTGIATLFSLLSGGVGAGALFLQIAAFTIAVSVLIGVVNLLAVHLRRIVGRQKGFLYSFVLVLAFLSVIALSVLGDSSASGVLLDIQVALESALAGLLIFALVYGAYRMMRQQVTWSAVLFTLALILILIGTLPFAETSAFQSIRAWILTVPASAGARGMLLGVALATIVASIRVLIGQERSYRE
jgi:hypothetical protein